MKDMIWAGLVKYGAPTVATIALAALAGLWIKGEALEASRDQWKGRAETAEKDLKQANKDLRDAAVTEAVLNERLTALGDLEQKQDEEARALALRALNRANALEGRLNDVFEANAPVVSGGDDGGPTLFSILREQNDAANRERRGGAVTEGTGADEPGPVQTERGADAAGAARAPFDFTAEPAGHSPVGAIAGRNANLDPVFHRASASGPRAGDRASQKGAGLAGSMAPSEGLSAAALERVAEPYQDIKGDGHWSQGTVTVIGSAKVTALHVLGESDPRIAGFQELDLAVLKLGETGPCRNAVEGEPVTVIGYPDAKVIVSTEGGWGFMSLREIDEGEIVVPSAPLMWRTDDGNFQRLTGEARTTKTRSGYSGGPLVSQIDGRIVGVHKSGVPGLKEGEPRTSLFIPIEVVCERVNALMADLQSAPETVS